MIRNLAHSRIEESSFLSSLSHDGEESTIKTNNFKAIPFLLEEAGKESSENKMTLPNLKISEQISESDNLHFNLEKNNNLQKTNEIFLKLKINKDYSSANNLILNNLNDSDIKNEADSLIIKDDNNISKEDFSKFNEEKKLNESISLFKNEITINYKDITCNSFFKNNSNLSLSNLINISTLRNKEKKDCLLDVDEKSMDSINMINNRNSNKFLSNSRTKTEILDSNFKFTSSIFNNASISNNNNNQNVLHNLNSISDMEYDRESIQSMNANNVKKQFKCEALPTFEEYLMDFEKYNHINSFEGKDTQISENNNFNSLSLMKSSNFNSLGDIHKFISPASINPKDQNHQNKTLLHNVNISPFDPFNSNFLN
jgi:hypothetical protein